MMRDSLPIVLLYSLLSAAVVAVSGSSAAARTYIVSGDDPLADDANPGTLAAPWRTIQHGIDTAVAGDTVLIRQAVYAENLATVRDGDPVAGPITFGAYPGEHPILDGSGVPAGVGLRIEHDHLGFAGLEICNWDPTAIWMTGAHHVTLSDCEVHHAWFGIGVGAGAHDFTLERVEIHHFTLYGFDASPSGGADCYGGRFYDCVAHTCNDPEQNVDGFALGHGEQHDFLFRRCETYGVFDGFDVSARNTRLERCSAHDCIYRGVTGWQDSLRLVNCLLYGNGVMNVDLARGQEGRHHHALINCTLMDAEVYNIYVDSTGAGIALALTNCIVAGGDNVGLWFEQLEGLDYTGDYNVFHNDNAARMIWAGAVAEFSLDQVAAGAWSAFSDADGHTQVATEAGLLFADPGAGDLHLRAGSCAIDAGTPAGAPDQDYDGRLRPLGAGVDVGAYEYAAAGALDAGRSPGQAPGNRAGCHAGRLTVSPDPLLGRGRLHYRLARGGEVAIACYDAGGRCLGRQRLGWQAAGAQITEWRPPPGTGGAVFLRLLCDGETVARGACRVLP